MDRKMNGYGGCVHPWVGQFVRGKDGKVGGGEGRMGTGCVCVGQRVVGGWVGCMSDSSISGRINKT